MGAFTKKPAPGDKVVALVATDTFAAGDQLVVLFSPLDFEGMTEVTDEWCLCVPASVIARHGFDPAATYLPGHRGFLELYNAANLSGAWLLWTSSCGTAAQIAPLPAPPVE